MQLLGSPKAVAIGDELNRCTWTLEYFAYGELTGDADWLLIVRDAYRLRKDFSFAARDDLGVTEAGIAVPEWKDAWTPRDHMIEVRRRVQPLPPSWQSPSYGRETNFSPGFAPVFQRPLAAGRAVRPAASRSCERTHMPITAPELGELVPTWIICRGRSGVGSILAACGSRSDLPVPG
ncbi:hypothetical protein [Nocardia sp. NPDC057440]|uniref:hypothetical protein n=1 Tax=Nocardia sp. NPDC057440 TaxID=3346134 RepID=UPI00366E4AE0